MNSQIRKKIGDLILDLNKWTEEELLKLERLLLEHPEEEPFRRHTIADIMGREIAGIKYGKKKLRKFQGEISPYI